jgi:hypothetical protein
MDRSPPPENVLATKSYYQDGRLHATDKPKEDSIRVAHIPRIVALRHEIRADASQAPGPKPEPCWHDGPSFTKLGRDASTPARIKRPALSCRLRKSEIARRAGRSPAPIIMKSARCNAALAIRHDEQMSLDKRAEAAPIERGLTPARL